MQMRPEVQIGSMVKALTDVIMPAIDAANKPALEQSQLIIGLLKLMASQLPVQFQFDRDELARLARCADALDAIDSKDGGVASALGLLKARRSTALHVLERCAIDPQALQASARDVKSAIGALVAAAADSGELNSQLHVEKVVLDMSRHQLLRDRSLMKLQGWEPDMDALPPIQQLLANDDA